VKNSKLRQELSIAIDWEEGYQQHPSAPGGDAAHGPIPDPACFGSRGRQARRIQPAERTGWSTAT